MFTNVMRQPQPHQFPYPLQSPSYSEIPFNFGHNRIIERYRGHRQDDGLHIIDSYDTFPRPQQYAHPLQSPGAGLNRSSLLDPRMPRADTSEHMLRRKTPNGTLAAGYDGTPVEWTESNHAHKHILMPILGSGRAQVQESPVISSPVQTLHGDIHAIPISVENQRYHQTRKQSVVPFPDRYGLGLAVDGDLGPISRQRNDPQTPTIDSMLHQGPSTHLPYNMGGFQQVPTMLQPMWPPCVGPTASNAPGPYGPYWPNGSYEPYRPAALRDGRFHTQFANFSINDSSDTHSTPRDPIHQPNASSVSPYDQESTCPGQPHWFDRARLERSADDFPYLQEQYKIQRQDLESLRYDVEQVQPHAVTDRSRPIHIKYPVSHGSEPALLPESPAAPSLSPLLIDDNSQSNNLQFKERVLVWAHRIYVNLLASIHYARKHNLSRQHPQERQQIHANIFPKPPQRSNSLSKYMGPVSDGDIRDVRNLHRARLVPSCPEDSSEPSRSVTTPRSQHDVDFQRAHGGGSHGRVDPCTGGQHTSGYYLNWQFSENRYGSGNATTLSAHDLQPHRTTTDARAALEMLARLARESEWKWTDGLLLGGCLAYGLGEYEKALQWYTKVLAIDISNVEAISNMAATLLALNRRKEAEQYWLRVIKLRPSYFEAVEHLVGLLCGDQRGREAVKIIEFVQKSLKLAGTTHTSTSQHPSQGLSQEPAKKKVHGPSVRRMSDASSAIEAGSSGYRIPESDNGRMISLIHAKGNMLYALGDNLSASKAFEDAIMLGAGRRPEGITGLINQILQAFSQEVLSNSEEHNESDRYESVLLPPEVAIQTAQLVFPAGTLPGLRGIPDGQAKRAAVSTTSNSLLSLAKIYQDGMSSSGATASPSKTTSGVQDILALYYLSLSLQPSPSTANNVGILLASVQQSVTPKRHSRIKGMAAPLAIPGVMPGSGIALALMYYNYGLNLDSRHAHLYTNLGSLLKDIGQLSAAIKMYEQAVACDGKFDIALANLANAVKDQGRISDAIGYYKRAVSSNPDFAEAVCGLANALNSVCDWRGRGGIVFNTKRQDRWHVDDQGMLSDAKLPSTDSSGWISRVVKIVDKQLDDGQSWGRGVLRSVDLGQLLGRSLVVGGRESHNQKKSNELLAALADWAGEDWEGAKVVRLVERATKRLGWQLYQDRYVHRRSGSSTSYVRPQLPTTLAIPSAPTVLPFHTFTCPLTAKQIRKISQRNGLRISCSTFRSPWLPADIFDPPPPPDPYLKVGYVSSDFNNHPLAHLMQSVFGFHNPSRVKAFCYATTASDGSVHREQIEREAPVFYDASAWTVDRLVKQIVGDGIHILINLNGYTRGARNEVFAARPAPIQMSFMGFAGTLGAEWCDYLLADTMSIPPQTLRPWRGNVDIVDQTLDGNNDDEQDGWVYGENIIYTRDTFFCCDHRQSAPDSQEGQLDWPDEQQRRWKMRKELFPELPKDTVILGNFNQLYKIEPTTFRTWLRILAAIPKSILWLLRFPDLGESNLRQTARLWAGDEVASRIIFTDVAPKHQHISRARVCDLFLDTPECNAHTTAADVLWSGTPLLTYPRYEYKMCSRMAASILKGALPKTAEGDQAGRELIVGSDEAYEKKAIELGSGLVSALQKRDRRDGDHCRLTELRKLLYEARWTSGLFDTRRWVRDLEEAYEMSWRKWVAGEGGDIWL